MKRKWLLFLIVVILLSCICVGCKEESTKKETKVEVQNEEGIRELLVAVNVDSSETELPFASVLLNRSRFWGTLVLRGICCFIRWKNLCFYIER